MVTKSLARSSNVFGAVADPTRRAILDRLRAGELRAGDLARDFPMSRPAIARHVRVLRQAGLLDERREAQARVYSLNPRALTEIDAWLSPYRLFWAARLMEIKRVAESQRHDTEEPPP